MADRKRNDDNAFFDQIGRCITSWAEVERELFGICHAALGATYDRAAIVYGRTPSIETRLNLVNDLVSVSLPPRARSDGGHAGPLEKEWESLFCTIKGLLPIRNVLAHHPVVTHVEFEQDESGQIARVGDVWMQYLTSEHESRRARKFPQPKIQDLRDHHEAVMALVGPLYAFHKKLLAESRRPKGE